MEIDPVKWISDVERGVVQNGRAISQLNTQIAQVQLDVRDSKIASKERSDERLEAIMNRFDQAERISGRRMGLAASFFFTVLTAVWFVVIQPLQEQIAMLDRRILDAERTIAVLISEPD